MFYLLKADSDRYASGGYSNAISFCHPHIQGRGLAWHAYQILV